MSNTTESQSERSRIYEVGFHIVPLLTEEVVAEEFSTIKNLIETQGGAFISEEGPRLRSLAYTLDKEISGKKQHFDQAYFGWVKFEVDAEALSKIKLGLEAMENVLRSLIFKTVRENTLISKRPATVRPDGERPAKTGEEGTISPEELDKTIDELVIE